MKQQQFANYIGGQWLNTTNSATNVNPSDLSDTIGHYAQADAAQTGVAIQAARDAFTQWAFSTPQQRADVLDKIGSEILARKEELGQLLSREEGKILSEGIGEVARAGQIFKYFAGESLRQSGDKLASVRPGIECEVTREPIGVVGIITPWNFPVAIPAWKIAPAIAYGNCVVFKPAELVPGTAWALSEIISRSGLPAGVFNLVMGPGRVVGEVLTESSQVDAISFTGSVATGRSIGLQCARSMKKFQLEMGGKNPLIVLDDADLDVAVECALNGSYYSTGQRCTASSKLVVTDKIHDQFVKALTLRLSHLRVGHALEAQMQMGPVVDRTQLDQDLRYIAIAKGEGGNLVFGGDELQRETKGHFLSPALFTETTRDMRINREEVFGPVASVIRVRDYDDALNVANDSEFGLSAGLCTSSLKHTMHFKRHMQAGMLMVNTPTAGVDFHVPFGGRKASSYGPREQGRYAAEFYTTVKTTYVAG